MPTDKELDDYTFTHNIAICASAKGFKRLYAYVHPSDNHIHFSIERDGNVTFMGASLKRAYEEYEAIP